MADELALTPDEAAFFSSGELTDALKAEYTPPPAPPEPEPDTAPSSSPPPQDDSRSEAPARDPATGQFLPKTPAAEPTPPDLAHFLADAESKRAVAEARLSTLQTQLDELSKPPPPKAPDRNEDPLGHFEHQLAEIANQLKGMRESETKMTEQRQIAEQQVAFVNSVRALRDVYAKTTPDFDAAYSHVRNIRLSELRDMGVPSPEQELAREEFALAAREVQRGQNPAERMYARAKKYGYAPPAAPAPAPADKIAAIKAAAEAAKSIERGTPPADMPTPATLKDASEDQLNKLVQDNAAWNRIMGKKTSIF